MISFKELLTEMPRLVSPMVFKDLENTERNRDLLYHLLKKSKIVQDNGDDALMIFGNNLAGTIYLYNKKESLIKYYVDYNKLNRVYVVQTKVWKDKKYNAAKNLPVRIVFDILLDKFGIIGTDHIQTPEGRGMWLNIIRHAASLGKYDIAIMDFDKNIQTDWDGKEDIESWLSKNTDNTWMKNKNGEDIIVFIKRKNYKL